MKPVIPTVFSALIGASKSIAIVGTPIGIPGQIGFGVGVCPHAALPAGFAPMPGYMDPLHPNYGNYLHRDGSVMVFIPKFYYRVDNAGNPTAARHTPNDIHVVGSDVFSSRAAAAVAGFALHRAFIDGDAEQSGFFIDKFLCSKQPLGSGHVAGSVRNAPPLSCSAAHNPVGDLTSVAGINAIYAFVTAAKARDGQDGQVNPSSRFFLASRFMWSALMMLSVAHGQSVTSQAAAAWYDPSGSTNFPKGCNNNSLRDANDAQVVFRSDGYSNCGQTGSGSPAEKTAHNGQACGVIDMNGLLWEANLGLTCIATTKGVTNAAQSGPCRLTVPGHGLETGRVVQVTGVGGMTALNDTLYTIAVIDSDTVSLDGVNATGYPSYTSGGSITFGVFYVAKESVRMQDFTSGATSATDHWGATGASSMMDEIALPLAAESGGSSMVQRWGNGASRVLAPDASGAGYVLTGIGFPSAGGMSTSGTSLFGQDYIYQYIRNELCVLSGGDWNSYSYAGACALSLYNYRGHSIGNVGFRCACYPG